MAQVTLVFNPDFSKVQTAVKSLKTELENISFDKNMLKDMTAYNNSVVKRVQSENALQIAVELRKTAEIQSQTAQKNLEKQMEATATAEERARIANTNRLTEIQRENTVLAIKGLEEAKAATAAERTANTEAKATLETKKRETAEAQLAVQQEKTATVTARAEAAQAKQNTALKEGSAASALMNNSLGSLVLQYVSLRAIINKVVSAFREALGTMKEVDSALVTIQKTTGFSKDQLDEVTKSAYELASAYGRTASEILDAASVYARAGFKDNLADMTELSALLQNVGDLSGETAAKFLVATNAAWKLDGSYEELLRVIDGLNEQTNQAAVDMEALTSGITVAGSVFANAGESVQTFAGLLGTGVAVTQRSGAEIARGLRTILMNVRQIKGELEDGEIIDETTISDAAAALHSVGISVADANGELRLTSDVLGELAGKWDSLTSAEQSYLAQSLAGKRQANVLTALMQNWEEAQRQMALYASGAGSAMKENEIYLNSWEAKTKQLDAAWTEFVANLVDTDTIKAALDGVIKIVQTLDTEFGHALITVVGVPTAIFAVVAAVAKLKASIAALNVTMLSNPVFLAIAAGTLAVYGIVKAVDALTTTTEEYAKAAEDAKTEYQNIISEIDTLKSKEEELTDLERRRLELLEKQAEVAKEQAKQATLDLYNSKYATGTVDNSPYSARYASLQRQLETASREEGKQIEQQMRELEKLAEGYGLQARIKDLISQYRDITRDMVTATSVEQLRNLQQAANGTMKEIMDLTEELRGFEEELGDELPEDGKKAIELGEQFILTADSLYEKSNRLEEAQLSFIENTDAADQMAKVFGVTLANISVEAENAGDKTQNASDKTNELRDSLQRASETATAYDGAIGNVIDSMDKFGDGSVEVYDAMTALEQAIPGSTAKIYDFDTATVTTREDIFGSKDALLDFIDTTKQLEFSQQIKELEGLAASYLDVAGAALEAMANQEAAAQMANVLRFTTTGSRASDINAQIEAIRKERDEWNATISALRARAPYSGGSGGGGGGGGGGSSGSGGSTTITDEELNRLKSIVSLRKQELSFLEASGAENDAITAKYKKIQESLHDQAEHLRQSLNTLVEQGAKDSEINALTQQITALSTEWWNIQKKIAAATGEIVDELENAAEVESGIVNRYSELGYVTGRQVREMGGSFADEESGGESDGGRTSYGSGVADTTDHVLEGLQKKVSLRKAELSYLQASGAEQSAILAKQREIQTALQKQAEYMRSIGADEAEILSLGTEWWNIQNNILDTLKKTQQTLFDQIRTAVDDYYDRIVNDKKQELEYEEKILAVQQAEAALANAQAERTVRYYNAATGQWEWRANAKNVKSAEDALAKAKESLGDYQKDQAWALFREAWNYVAEKLKDGSMTFRDAYDYMLASVKEISDKYGVDMSGVLKESLGSFEKMGFGIEGLTQEITDLIRVSVGALEESLRDFDEVLRGLIAATGGAAAAISTDIWKLFGWGDGSGFGSKTPKTAEEAMAWNAARLGTPDHPLSEGEFALRQRYLDSRTHIDTGYFGVSTDNPYTNPLRWIDPEAWAAYSNLQEADDAYKAALDKLAAAWAAGASKEELDALENALYSSNEGSFGYFGAYQGEGGTTGFVKAGFGNANGEHLLMLNGQLYESGVTPGTMLQDLWGNRWEVGDDGHTLTAIDRAWDDPMMDLDNSDMGFSGAGGGLDASGGRPGISGASIGNQYNGNTYNFGNISLNENEAKATTVYDFARLAGGLGGYGGER